MAKFHGQIGYLTTEEKVLEDGTRTGVWEKSIQERDYMGDVIKNTMRWQDTSSVNGDISISNQISIIADEYATANIGIMRYVTYMGTKWAITSIDVAEHPRLILSLGGVYNE